MVIDVYKRQVLAFAIQFSGFNGAAKEKMHRFQSAQEDMNNASVE